MLGAPATTTQPETAAGATVDVDAGPFARQPRGSRGSYGDRRLARGLSWSQSRRAPTNSIRFPNGSRTKNRSRPPTGRALDLAAVVGEPRARGLELGDLEREVVLALASGRRDRRSRAARGRPHARGRRRAPLGRVQLGQPEHVAVERPCELDLLRRTVIPTCWSLIGRSLSCTPLPPVCGRGGCSATRAPSGAGRSGREREREPGARAHLGRVDPEADERLHVRPRVEPAQLPEELAGLRLLVDDDLIGDAPPELQRHARARRSAAYVIGLRAAYAPAAARPTADLEARELAQARAQRRLPEQRPALVLALEPVEVPVLEREVGDRGEGGRAGEQVGCRATRSSVSWPPMLPPNA